MLSGLPAADSSCAFDMKKGRGKPSVGKSTEGLCKNVYLVDWDFKRHLAAILAAKTFPFLEIYTSLLKTDWCMFLKRLGKKNCYRYKV